MAKSLGSLTVDLILKMGGFTQGMDQAARALDAHRKSMEKSLAGIKNAFSTLGVGFSAAGIIFGLEEAAKAAIAFGASVQNAAQKTGASAETMSELAFAAKQADVDLQTVTGGMIKMQKVIAEATAGNKAAADAIAAIGLHLNDLKGKDAETQLEIVADAIHAIGDDSARTAALLAIFGKSGAELAPLFAEGAKGIRDARDAAHEFGATLTAEQAKALADADDAVERLKSSFGGLAAQMTAAVAPTLITFFDALSLAISGTESKHRTWLEELEFSAKVYARAAVWYKAFIPSIFDLSQAYVELTKEAHAAAAAGQAAAAPFGDPRRTRAVSRGPGGLAGQAAQMEAADAADKAKAAADALRAATAAQAAAAREAAEALQKQADAYKNVLTAGQAAIDALKTPLEQEIDQYHEAKFALEELARTYPNMADQATEALKRLENQGLEVPVITAVHIFPPKEQDKLSEFWLQAQRNAQDILAGFLEDPFHAGIEGMLADFTDMLRKMAAQAVAADISDALFGDLKKVMSGDGGIASKAGDFFGGLVDKVKGIFTSGAATPPFVAPGSVTVPGSVAGAAGAATTAATTAATDAATTAATSASMSAAITAAGTAVATAITAAGTAAGGAFTAAMATATAALTTAGTAVAGAITAAGAEAAAAIAAAAVGSAGSSAFSSLAISAATSGGAAGGGFTGYGGKFEPAGLFHRKEFVVRSEATMQPGAIPFLREFNMRGMALLRDLNLPGFAGGGMVMSPMMIPGRGMTAPTGGGGRNAGTVVNQAINVTTQGGNISRQTELQLTAAAARGVRNADRRNN